MSAGASGTGPAELAGRLRLAISRLNRQLRNQQIRGLTPSQLSALYTVEQHGPLRLSDLACHERVRRATLTRCAASLEDLGLLERRADPDDGRAALMALSPVGRRLVDDLRRERTTLLTRRLEALDAAQRRTLAAALPVLEALTADEPYPTTPPGQPCRVTAAAQREWS